MNAINITHTGTDHHQQDELNIHWFQITGHCSAFGIDLDGEYGWADNNGRISILDADGFPLTDGDGKTEAVRQEIGPVVEALSENQITPADESLICQWANCRYASVDRDGDVWIEQPQTGHWLSADKKADYLAWRASQ